MIYTKVTRGISVTTNKVNGNFLDTEEASETDMGKSEEYTEIKEQ